MCPIQGEKFLVLQLFRSVGQLNIQDIPLLQPKYWYKVSNLRATFQATEDNLQV